MPSSPSPLQRTVGGFRLGFRFPLVVERASETLTHVAVLDLSAELRCRPAEGDAVIVGSTCALYADVVPIENCGYREPETWFDVSAGGLAWIEATRPQAGPVFDLGIHGALVGCADRARMTTLPFRFHGNSTVTIPAHEWTAALRRVGASHALLIEVPSLDDPSREYAQVIGALDDAVQELERGGNTGWKGCVGAVRTALERWAATRPPTRPSEADRSVRRRLDELRVHLRAFTNDAHHSTSEAWTREDAVLALATAAALLARELKGH